MVHYKNLRPQSYSPSNNGVAKYLVHLLMPHIIGSNHVYVDYDDTVGIEELEQYTMVLAPPALWSLLKIILSPTYQPGETYQKGDWYLKKGDLHEFIEALYENKERLFFRYFNYLSKFRGMSFLLRQRLFVKFFTRRVQRHYDTDSDLYASFLDKEMVYTCAFFEEPDDDLLSAQMRKLDTVISRMKLPPHDVNVLEIGCGWGSLSRRIVSTQPNVNYVGLTIAGDQLLRAEQIDAQNLTDDQRSRISYRKEDYLDHKPNLISGYDGISAIGMMEHVGLGHYDIFLQKICSLLKPGGRAVIHTIIAGASGEPTNGWIDRYIFHGGYAPSLAEITSASENCDCNIEGIFVYDPKHYRTTIECWLTNFLGNWDSYRKMKIPDWSEARASKLFKIWYFYLSAVRNMFVPSAMNFHVAHVVVKKA